LPGYRLIRKHSINPETQTKYDPGSTNNFIGPQASQLAIIFNPGKIVGSDSGEW